MRKITLQLSLKEAEHVYLALKLYNKAILKGKCDNDGDETIAEETNNVCSTLNGAISRNSLIATHDVRSYYENNAEFILDRL